MAETATTSNTAETTTTSTLAVKIRRRHQNYANDDRMKNAVNECFAQMECEGLRYSYW